MLPNHAPRPVLLLPFALLAACASTPEPTPRTIGPRPEPNLLGNSSFENPTRAPWTNYADRSPTWVDFTIDDERAIDGNRAAKLTLDSGDPVQPKDTNIHGVVQTIGTPRMPKHLSGAYFVEDWQRGTERQYIQAVVIAGRPANAPRGGVNYPSYQLAVTLAGVTEPPITIGNRRFEITGPENPETGAWVDFEIDLHQLFSKHWNFVPDRCTTITVFFETRYDKRTEDEPRALATVRFDDLYAGDVSRELIEIGAPESEPSEPEAPDN